MRISDYVRSPPLGLVALIASLTTAACGSTPPAAREIRRPSRSSTCPTTHARALSRIRCRVRQPLEEQDRPDRDHPDFAWRLGQSGPRGHRRTRGRRRHPGARVRRRRDRERRPDRQGLAEALAEQQHAVYVDDRVSRAQGQPEERSRTGATSSSLACRSSRRIRRRPAARSGTTWPRGSTRARCPVATTRPPAPS